ncbi:LysR family transcriptional regulator [Pigmentiphaga aceris]|uniref:LysR family transcriptional regulator n=1 Tax=Pigmentiphaga aceris TaxID=1940612 RepID=A0A5C0B6Q2_9BURK|nr:LysR substrate-binding domain-containing protein [Pigmentiphaga aceris]QEI08631.1 LysR family transcriptional regulator [Pigmentiphaga aceris]
MADELGGRVLSARQVEAFQTVMVTRSMTEAAELMHVSQPAISRLIHDMEAALGFALFERKGPVISATLEAIELVDVVHKHYVGLTAIRERADDIAARLDGELRIGVTPALALHYVPELLASLASEIAPVGIVLETGTSLEMIARAAAGQVDVAIAVVNSTQEGVGLIHLPPLEAVCVLPTGHRLGNKEWITPGDLVGESYVALARSAALQIQIDRVLAADGVQLQRRVHTTMSATVCSMVQAGMGVGIIDPLTAFSLAGSLMVRPFRPAVPYHLEVILPPSPRRPAAARRLADALSAKLMKDFREIAPGLRSVD